MTPLVLALLGSLLGLVTLGQPGILLGAAIGALAGAVIVLSGRLHRLEQRVELQLAAEARLRAGAKPSAPAEAASKPTVAPESERSREPLVVPSTAAAIENVQEAPGAREPEAVSPRSAQQASARRPWDSPSASPRALEPSVLDRTLARVVQWFTTGNVPVKVGVVLSVFGVGFLVKEGIDRHWLVLPIEARLALVALFGVALLGLGWRLRVRAPVYALSVQGGGVAVLYLTIYASFAIYHLLPAALAFAFLVVVTAAAVALAVLQGSLALAVLGIAGGFMAPVLASTGAGNHVALFGYYTVLNVAVVAIAWFKSWRSLNVLGFLFTFGIGTLWGANAYRPELFASTEPFLVLFTLIYVLIPVLFATRSAPRLHGFVDGTIVFGTPIVAFALQSRLLAGDELALAASAVGLAALYVGLATYLYRRHREALRVLVEAQLSLGVVFVTVAVPLALDARWTSAAWALQGAALVWLGFRQQRRLALAAGLVLQALSAAAFAEAGTFGTVDWPIFNGRYLGGLLLALAAGFSARLFDPVRNRPVASPLSVRLGKTVAIVLLLWGGWWWFASGFTEIDRLTSRLTLHVALAFGAATVWLAMGAAKATDWPRLNWLAVALWPLALFVAATDVLDLAHPAASFGWLVWPAVAVTMLSFLKARESEIGINRALHVLGFWLGAALLAWEAHWAVGRLGSGVWPEAAALVVGAAVVLGTLSWRGRIAWPLGAHVRVYVQACAGGVLAALLAATLFLNVKSPGAAAPLPYVPLMNPLELASVLALIALLKWLEAMKQIGSALARFAPQRAAIAALFAWFLVTMAVARAVHHWAGVPYDLDRLAASTTFQSALSIVWGIAGLAAMTIGARTGRRAVWIAGAVLMGIVVVKLFLVELGNSGTLARVVSFLGVGALLLVVGYFAPVPPRRAGDLPVGDGQRGEA